MKNNELTKLCPILDFKRFEKIFRSISESISGTKTQKTALDWYSSIGKEKLRKYSSWENNIASGMRLKRPKPDDVDAFEKYLTTIDSWDNEKWLSVAKKVIQKNLNTDIFEFAGMGSSKVCLYSKNGEALKFGRNGNSLRQEIENNLMFSNYSCVPKLFDYDEQNYSSYICEFARQTVPNDFKILYGISGAAEFFDCLMGKPWPKKLGLEQLKCAGQMADMIEDLDLLDVDGEHNLGITVRNGTRVIIFIDYDL